MIQDIDVPRILIYDHLDNPLFELDPTQLHSAQMVEEINGEHSLTLVTTEVLEKQQRVLMQDETNKVREWVVTGLDELHSDMLVPLNTYYCIWSLQHDLDVTVVNSMPGIIQQQGKTVVKPVSSTVALEHALASTKRWTIGTVTQNTNSSGSMYYRSGWEALGVVVNFWGGEIDADITVDRLTNKVSSRKVCLYNHLGDDEAVRRFDYSYDLKSIKRTVADSPYTCRITPRGRGEEGDGGGYGRRITIADVNGGVEWIQDDEVVPLTRVPKPGGGYEYPNQIVTFEDISEPQKLLDYAKTHLAEYTRPRVTYEADVAQLAEAGMDAQGIALGDVVQCIDKGFTENGLRIEGRIKRLVTDLFGVDEIAI